MKLTLCCVVLCLVSLSYQQQYFNPNNYYDPRLQYFFYPNAGQPFNNYFGTLPQAKGIFQSILPTLTRYVTSVVTSTAAVAQFKSCISSTQFATVGAVTSTAACSAVRRRRDMEIAISPVLPSEASAAPVALPSGFENSDMPQPAVEISSSLWTPMEHEYRHPQARFLSATTYTLYSTTVVYTATTVTQRFNLANAASLLCVPPGFSVC